MRTGLMIFLAALILAIPAQAAVVEVEVVGYVYFNQARSAPLNQVNAGENIILTFQVDSDVFYNSPNFPTRGYDIDLMSYAMSFTGGVTVPLMDPPYQPGVPYFVIRNNDPAADGFFLAHNNVDWPFPGLYLDTWGFFGPFESHFDVSYTEDTLPSLDILDALGTYEYDGLTRFYYSVNDGPFEVMGIDFLQMTISLLPVEVAVDIKPEGCPNPLNQRSHGKTPVAIMGTPDLDVATIDPASIRLEGVPGMYSNLEDVGTPFEPYLGKSDCDYDCNDFGPDGYMDLTVKFDTSAIMDMLGDVENGECRVLHLTGTFREEFGGGPIIGEDVVVIVPKATPGGGGSDRLVNPQEDPGPLDPDPRIGFDKFN